MNIVVRSLGIVVVLIGIVYLLKPTFLRPIIEFFAKGRRMYLVGLVRLTVAVVFLISARECKHFWMIFAFGILFLISGLLIFILGADKVKSVIEWYQKQSIWVFRIFGLIALAFGSVIIFSA